MATNRLRTVLSNGLVIVVAESERRGEQLDQPRIHAGDDGDAFVGVFVRDEAFVALLGYETAVECENLVDHGRNVFQDTKIGNLSFR